MILPSLIEKPEGQLGPGHLTPSLKMTGQGLGTWPWGCRQLRSVSSAGPGHWQEGPDWVLDERTWAGTPPLSQDLDLRRWKLSLGTLLFFIRTENNICFGEVYRNLVTLPGPTSRTKDLTPSCYCSVAPSCLTLYDPMDCCTPGFSILHHLLELPQTHIHWVGDAIQPSCPLSSRSPPAFNLSLHHGLF